MDAVGSLIDLGINFAPVPGLKPAFDLVKFIWDNVQKASYNRKALRDLAKSTADLLKAVNYVLSHTELNENVQVHLNRLEGVFHEIGMFAEEHATANLFKILVKNIDIEGRNEYFQHRLQQLSMAFSIASYGDIKDELVKIYQGQLAIADRLPSSPSLVGQGIKTPTQPGITDKPANKRIRVIDYEPVRVEASFSEPCRIELRKEVPKLTCPYFGDVNLSYWGLKTSETKISKKTDSFHVFRPRDSKTWTWTVSWRIISVSVHNPAYSGWKDTLDIIFPTTTSAADWFTWLETYASYEYGVPTAPPSNDVGVRKKYDGWMQKTPTRVERRQTPDAKWWNTIQGRGCRAYATHFTYMGDSTLPFTTVYRSVDTLVMERCERAYDEEPTASRRYRFGSEEEAKAWYIIWRDCAKDPTGVNEPARVEVTFKDPFTIHVRDHVPVLDSAISTKIVLHAWGLQTPSSNVTITKAKFEVATLTTSWTWLQRDNRVVVHTVIASQPDWHDSLEIAFVNAKCAEIWFAYLMKYRTVGLPSSLPPRAEHVVVTMNCVSWLQKQNTSIQLRTGVSDKWHPIFEEYKTMQIHSNHLALVGSSIFPHLRITRSGQALMMERKGLPNDTDVPVSRRYQFNSKAEATSWYEIWKQHLQNHVGVTG